MEMLVCNFDWGALYFLQNSDQWDTDSNDHGTFAPSCHSTPLWISMPFFTPLQEDCFVSSLHLSKHSNILTVQTSWRDFEVSFAFSASLQNFLTRVVRVIVPFIYAGHAAFRTPLSPLVVDGWLPWLVSFSLVRNLGIPNRNDWFASLGVSFVWMVLCSYFNVFGSWLWESTGLAIGRW